MRHLLLTTALAIAAVGTATEPAAAETPSAAVGHDPLMRQIMSKQLTQDNGGITGAVRIASGQAIVLDLADPLAAAPLKDAVADPKALSPLKPAEGLKAKEEAKPKRVRHHGRRAAEQLRKLSEEERKADWSGRK